MNGERICSDTLRKNAEKEKAKIIQGQKDISDIWQFIHRLNFNLHFFWSYFRTESMSLYLVKNMTKRELAQQYLSEQNVTERELFFLSIIDSVNHIQLDLIQSTWHPFENLMKQYESHFYKIIDLMYEGYGNLREEKPIIINDSNAQRLQLVQKALTVDDLTDLARKGDVKGILQKISNIIAGSIQHVDYQIMRPLPQIRASLKKVENNLREYQESIKMDNKFYL